MDRRRNTREASAYLKEKWGIKRTPGTLEVLRSRWPGPGSICVLGEVFCYPESNSDAQQSPHGGTGKNFAVSGGLR